MDGRKNIYERRYIYDLWVDIWKWILLVLITVLLVR